MRGILLSGAIASMFAFFATPLLIKLLTKKAMGKLFEMMDLPLTKLSVVLPLWADWY